LDLESERVLVAQHPHWARLLGPALLTAVAVAAAVATLVELSSPPRVLDWVLIVLVALPALWMLGRLGGWLGTMLTVTDRRVVVEHGILGRHMTQLRLRRIVDIHCRQYFVERILGSGRLVIEVEGEGLVVIDHVRRPRRLQRVLTRQLDMLDWHRRTTSLSRPHWTATSRSASSPPVPGDLEVTPSRGVRID